MVRFANSDQVLYMKGGSDLDLNSDPGQSLIDIEREFFFQVELGLVF